MGLRKKGSIILFVSMGLFALEMGFVRPTAADTEVKGETGTDLIFGEKGKKQKEYEYLETFDLPDINEQNWGIVQTDKEKAEIKVVEGKLYVSAKGRNVSAGLRTVKKFTNKEFTLEFDIHPIPEEKHGAFSINFPASSAYNYWSISLIHASECVQIYTLDEGEAYYHGGAVNLPADTWLHFEIKNYPDKVMIKVTEMKENGVIYEKTLPHDELNTTDSITLGVGTGELENPELKGGYYIDNIGWTKEKIAEGDKK